MSKQMIKSVLREAIEAPPGHKLVVVDSSGIELRIHNTLWLHMPAVNAWAKDRKADIYSMTATDLLGRVVTKADPVGRGFGKLCDLGCIFGASHNALFRQAKRNPELKALVTLQQLEVFVGIWRKTHQSIVDGWDILKQSLPYMAAGNSSLQTDPWGLTRIEKDRVRLPSGRYLYYPNLRQAEKKAKNGRLYKEWVFGVNRAKKLYGGLLAENYTQSLARDVFMEKVMLLKWRYNIRAALTVYDEMVAVVPESHAEWALEKMLEVFREPISWWPQVVLDAEGDIADNYADAK